MKTLDFFSNHPVFSLAEANEALSPMGDRSGTLNRLKYHLKAGRLKPVCRGVYAVVPPTAAVDRFLPDPIFVAAAVQPDGVFSHHSALELLGVAHSMWQQCTLYVPKRRRPLAMSGASVRFIEHPTPFRGRTRLLGVRKIERQGRLLQTTGPERTLVDGFSRPSLAGGAEELVRSAGSFAVLDLGLLETVLKRHGIANLWAATGWFLERFQETFHVPEAMLARMEQRRPRSKQYLERGRRGGILAKRWNLILPKEVFELGEPDER
jgi:predicted transcriptional regulator of viral defense system